MEEQLYGFYQFPDSKNHWEEKYFLKFLVSRNVFKKGYFCQFLASKIYDKIWHCFNIFCNFCVSENFDMSPVTDLGITHKINSNMFSQYSSSHILHISIPKLGHSELVLESGDNDGVGVGEDVFGSWEWIRRGG